MTIYMNAAPEMAAERFRDTTTRVIELFRSTNWHSDQEAQDRLRQHLAVFLARGEEARILASCVPPHRRCDLKEVIFQAIVGSRPQYQHQAKFWQCGDWQIPGSWPEQLRAMIDADRPGRFAPTREEMAASMVRFITATVFDGLYAKVG